MNPTHHEAQRLLRIALLYVNLVLVPIFIVGVALFLTYRWSILGMIGLALAAASPFIAYIVAYIAFKKGIIKLKPPTH